MCFPPKEPRSQTRTECSLERYQTLNTTTPVHQGIHLDRTLCYKMHIEKTKMVNARNNIIRKLANSKWGVQGIDTQTQLSRPLLLSCRVRLPCVGKVYTRAKLNPALHDCCRIILGCLKPTNLDSVHILAGIAPPHIKSNVACRMERSRQTPDTNCSITNQLLAD